MVIRCCREGQNVVQELQGFLTNSCGESVCAMDSVVPREYSSKMTRCSAQLGLVDDAFTEGEARRKYQCQAAQ
jgi:hypothetical protein